MTTEFDGILRIRMTKARAVAWAGTVLFGSAAAFSWVMGLPIAVALFGAFAALSAFLLLSCGDVAVDAESVTHETYLGRYRMLWRDVERIERDPTGSQAVFSGHGKRLVIPGPMFWSGADRHAFSSLIGVLTREYGIAAAETPAAAYKLSKNTRID